MKRKRSSKEFKVKVAIAVIKGQKTANELASEYEVHSSQINTWKKQALPEVFDQGRQPEAEAQEAERDRLYQQIGKLQVEVDWLKKRPNIWHECGGETPVNRAGTSESEHPTPVRADRLGEIRLERRLLAENGAGAPATLRLLTVATYCGQYGAA